jgi:hypothetical protein
VLTHPQHSTAFYSTIADSKNEQQLRKHLTNINIGKILELAKALIPQRKIVSLLKCSQKAVQYTLATYLFETFQGHNPKQEYKWKTSKHKDQYIECALKQHSSTPLNDITNIIELLIFITTLCHQQSEAGLVSYVVTKSPGYRLKMLLRGWSGHNDVKIGQLKIVKRLFSLINPVYGSVSVLVASG